MSQFLQGEVSKTQIGNLGQAYDQSTALQQGFVSVADGSTMVPGYEYAANTKGNVRVRHIPFVYSQQDAYVIEFGPLYIRFYRNDSQITSGASPYEVTTTYTATELLELSFEQENDVLYITHNDHQRAKLVRYDHDSWVLSDLDMVDGPFQLENTTSTTIEADDVTGSVTLTASDDVWESGNVNGLYRLRHDLAEQRVEGTISGTGASSAVYVQKDQLFQVTVPGTWSATITVQFSTDNSTWEDYTTIISADDKQVAINGVNEEGNVDEITIAAEDQYVRINVTSYTSGEPEFLIAANSYSHIGTVRIDTVTDAQNATGTVLQRLGSTDATIKWSEGSWSTRRGFPATSWIENKRLCHASSIYEPEKIWESKTNDPERHRSGVLATDAFQQTLANIKDPIKWVQEDNGGIRVGTQKEIAIYLPASQGAAGPLNPYKLHRKVNFPCSYIEPVSAGYSSLVMNYGGTAIGEVLYNEEQRILYVEDKTRFSKHLFRTDDGVGIVDMAFQARPYPILWCVRSDGEFICISHDRLIGLTAPSRAGYVGEVESVCVIPKEDYDQVWISAKYTVDGSDVRFVGYMDKLDVYKPAEEMNFYEAALKFNGGSANITAVTNDSECQITLDAWPEDGNGNDLVDGENIYIQDVVGATELNNYIYTVSDANSSAKTLKLKDQDAVGYIDSSGFGTWTSGGTVEERDNTFGGLSHWGSEELYYNLNGDIGGTVTPSGGSISLGDYYKDVACGGYQTRKFRPMPIESLNKYGQQKQISGLYLMMFRSVGGRYSPLDRNGDFSEERAKELDWSKLQDPLEWEALLSTGLLTISDSLGCNTRIYIEFQQEYGLPMTFLRIDPEVK